MASTPIIHMVPMALLGLSVLAGSASAECAWVLWTHGDIIGEYPPDTKLDGPWKPLGGWTTRSECEAEKALALKREERRRGTPEAKADWQRFMGEYADKAKLVIEHVCLPDAVDPRGPRGK
jgi:hypothetical protein